MKKKEKVKINEKIFIVMYNQGKNDTELSLLFERSERDIQRYISKLRAQGKVQYRKSFRTVSSKKEKTHFKFGEVFEEVKEYLDSAEQIYSKRKNVFENVKLKIKPNKTKQKEDVVIVWSDMHTGMINKHPISQEITYDEGIQEKELQSFLRGVYRFHKLQSPSYNLETCHIFDVGDNITNDRIFEGQLSEITCGVGEQILKCFEYQTDFIMRMLEIFPKVKMVKLGGNHGRTTNKPIGEDASNNFEYLLGIMLQERFKDNKRVEIIVPNSYTYLAKIHGHKYLLSHGNIVRGCSLNSIEKAVKDIASLVYKDFYDMVIIGHFHTALKLKITPETDLLVNGCWIKDDSYAYNKLHKFSSPTQWMFNVSKKSAMHGLQEIQLKWGENK